MEFLLLAVGLLVGAALGYLATSLRAARTGGADAEARTELAVAKEKVALLEAKVAEVNAAAGRESATMEVSLSSFGLKRGRYTGTAIAPAYTQPKNEVR